METHVVADVMERNFITASPDTSVFDLVNLMVQHNASVIPIVNDDGVLAGIVTEADLVYKKMRLHIPSYVRAMGDKIYYNNGLNMYGKGYKKQMAYKADELMTKDVVVASPKASIEQIADIMVSEHLKLIPVVDGSKLVGIVTRRNILNELYKDYKG